MPAQPLLAPLDTDEPLGQRSPLGSVSAAPGQHSSHAQELQARAEPRNRGQTGLKTPHSVAGNWLGAGKFFLGVREHFHIFAFLFPQGRAGSSAGLHTLCQHWALAARPETAQVPIPRNPRAVTWELPSALGAAIPHLGVAIPSKSCHPTPGSSILPGILHPPGCGAQLRQCPVSCCSRRVRDWSPAFPAATPSPPHLQTKPVLKSFVGLRPECSVSCRTEP